MNWMMVAVGVLQISAGLYGFYIDQGWRISTMNMLVGVANLVLAGGKA